MDTAKYVTLEDFTVNTANGPRTIHRGEVLSLTDEKANHLEKNVRILRVIAPQPKPTSDLKLHLIHYQDRVQALQATAGLPPQLAERIAADAVVAALKREQALTKTMPKPSAFDPPRTSKYRFNRVETDNGVGEWATHSYNIAKGCDNGCQYCYAKAMAKRTGRISEDAEWEVPSVEMDKTEIYEKVDGTVMFPSTHDITPTTLNAYLTTAENILRSGNRLLIVSKPSMQCIPALCASLLPYREEITFRFTVSTMDENTTSLLEPGAPSPEERITCLKHAYEMGFKTSVSSEPLLGGLQTAQAIYASTEPFITENIWFGKLNKPPIKNQPSPVVEKLAWIKQQQTDDRIKGMHLVFAECNKVQWKDSIQKVIG
jgi:hypothetical protein